MSWLLDVNVLLASRWTTHPEHHAAKKWIDATDRFFTTAITELGFIRISLMPCVWGVLGGNPGNFDEAPSAFRAPFSGRR